MANKTTILICEDEPLIQDMYNTYLTELGYNILLANNGKQSVEIALAEQPDLILLDILMPMLDGYGVLKKLRKDKWGKTAGVIVLSNLSMNDDKKFTEEMGVLDFVVKADHSLQEIGEMIEKALAK